MADEITAGTAEPVVSLVDELLEQTTHVADEIENVAATTAGIV